jgi:CheY-like chemotaxis protein
VAAGGAQVPFSGRPARADVVTTKRARILLVEDDAAVQSALLGALEPAGFEATGAGDAAEALGALAQYRFDVVQEISLPFEFVPLDLE